MKIIVCVEHKKQSCKSLLAKILKKITNLQFSFLILDITNIVKKKNRKITMIFKIHIVNSFIILESEEKAWILHPNDAMKLATALAKAVHTGTTSTINLLDNNGPIQTKTNEKERS